MCSALYALAYRTTTYSAQAPFAGKNATRWPSLNLFAAFAFVPSRTIVPTSSNPGTLRVPSEWARPVLLEEERKQSGYHRDGPVER